MRLVDVRRGEWPALAWAAGWFFCVLASYYPLRSVRDAQGVAAGPDGLRWLFTATLVTMILATPLYGRVVATVPRAWLPAVVYGFFASNLIAIWLGLTWSMWRGEAWLWWTFYVWVSVFNLFAVTLFWSFAVDLFNGDQAKRLFGVIAGAGTLGALAGSEASRWIVRYTSTKSVLWLSAGLLVAVIVCARQFRLAATAAAGQSTAPSKPSPTTKKTESLRDAMAGMIDIAHSRYLTGIAALMVLSSVAATMIYMQMSEVVGQQIADSAARTDWYARLNNYQNMLTLIGQTAAASWLIRRIGLAATLTIVPVIYAVGFTALAMHPTLAVLGALDVAQRVGAFAIGVPAREVLFTTVTPDEKYRAKAFIDTVGKRTGDTAAAHGFALLHAWNWTTTAVSWAMLPVAGIVAAISIALGRTHDARASAATARSPLSDESASLPAKNASEGRPAESAASPSPSEPASDQRNRPPRAS